MIAAIMRYGLFALAFFVSLFITQTVAAQENITTSSAETTVTPTPQADYSLPYPGILPDNPLYTLKMIRDRIVLFLINDPVKKAEFTLLQADKRLQSGTYLYRENPQKVELAIKTIAKGENYFFQAIQHAKKVQKEGRTDFNNIVADLRNASLKHEETLVVLEKEFPKEYRSQINHELKRVQAYQKEVEGLRPSR